MLYFIPYECSHEYCPIVMNFCDRFAVPRANPESPRLGIWIWIEKDRAISAPLSISESTLSLIQISQDAPFAPPD